MLFIFIIFGANTRFKTVDEGEFYCPYENATRHYERKKAALWVTLYFLPLFPIKQQDEVIECRSCGRTYNVDVLDNPARYQHLRQQQMQWQGQPGTKSRFEPDFEPRTTRTQGQADPVKLVNNMKARLQDGTPIEYIVRDLTAAGFDRDVVLQMINAQIGSERRYCPDCGLTYAPNVSQCPECGSSTR